MCVCVFRVCVSRVCVWRWLFLFLSGGAVTETCELSLPTRPVGTRPVFSRPPRSAVSKLLDESSNRMGQAHLNTVVVAVAVAAAAAVLVVGGGGSGVGDDAAHCTHTWWH